MLAAVIEHFLDHVSEREFDAPFIALLLKLGFGDVHYLHGQYEFGKDFIARAIEDGRQVQDVFQSKAGDLNLGDWSKGTPQLDLLRTNTLAHRSLESRTARSRSAAHGCCLARRRPGASSASSCRSSGCSCPSGWRSGARSIRRASRCPLGVLEGAPTSTGTRLPSFRRNSFS